MADRSQAVAAGSGFADAWSFDPKAAEKCANLVPDPVTVATIATIAATEADPLPWDNNLARFIALSCPDSVPVETWDELQGDAEVTSRLWGRRALELGWSALDIFGCNPDPFGRRVDRNGLVITLVRFAVPLRIVDITAECAVLLDPRGHVLRHRLGGRQGQVLLWDAYPSESGP